MRFVIKYSNLLLLIFIISCGSTTNTQHKNIKYDESKFLVHIVNPKEGKLKFYLNNEDGKNYGDFQNLASSLSKNGKQLLFATNGGMYLKDQSPQGLYIENGKLLKPIDTIQNAYGNFYMQPNGVFYLTKNGEGIVTQTSEFINSENVNYATQSGPMLITDGEIHSRFIQGSKNMHIRNGVGILPNGNLLFVISKVKVNFFDLANLYKTNGCKNALYLDGYVSRCYLPQQNWIETDGNLGVIIAETK